MSLLGRPNKPRYSLFHSLKCYSLMSQNDNLFFLWDIRLLYVFMDNFYHNFTQTNKRGNFTKCSPLFSFLQSFCLIFSSLFHFSILLSSYENALSVSSKRNAFFGKLCSTNCKKVFVIVLPAWNPSKICRPRLDAGHFLSERIAILNSIPLGRNTFYYVLLGNSSANPFPVMTTGISLCSNSTL